MLVPVILIVAVFAFGRWIAGGSGKRGAGQGWYRDIGGGRGPGDGAPDEGEPRSRDMRSGHWRSHGTGSGGAGDPDDGGEDDMAG